jgi:hypothetical protein
MQVISLKEKCIYCLRKIKCDCENLVSKFQPKKLTPEPLILELVLNDTVIFGVSREALENGHYHYPAPGGIYVPKGSFLNFNGVNCFCVIEYKNCESNGPIIWSAVVDDELEVNNNDINVIRIKIFPREPQSQI